MKNLPSFKITRGRFLAGGAALIGGSLLSQFLPGSHACDGKSDNRDPIPIPELSLEEARQKLVFWNDTARTSVKFRKGEPALSLILGLLLFKHRQEGTSLDGYSKNPLYSEVHAFFTQVRIRRILQAVSSGEADERVSEILQWELDKTGGFGPIWSQMPLFLHRQAYLKVRILECFDEQELKTTPTVRNWKGHPGNVFPSCKFALAEILALPLRDPFHERKHDFA